MSLHNLGIKDEAILAKTAELLQQKKFPNVNAITNLLYAIAKSGYKHKDTLWIAAALDKLLNEPKLDTYTACRNLWNLQALDYRSDLALAKFAETIVAADVNKLNEVDIANSLHALAHFNHVDFDCIEKLLKQTIRKAQDFKLQTLAVIANSLADMDVANPTFLEILK